MPRGFDSPAQAVAREHFVQRALVLGCTGDEASLWAQIAVERGWTQAEDTPQFDRDVLDYLVQLGSGETWSNDLRQLLERVDPP